MLICMAHMRKLLGDAVASCGLEQAGRHADLQRREELPQQSLQVRRAQRLPRPRAARGRLRRAAAAAAVAGQLGQLVGRVPEQRDGGEADVHVRLRAASPRRRRSPAMHTDLSSCG